MSLHQGVQVAVSEVLIQIHAVVQVLKTCDAGEDDVFPLFLSSQPHVREVTTIAAIVVISDVSHCRLWFRSTGRTNNASVFIGIASLVQPLMTNGEVKVQTCAGFQDETHPCTEAFLVVHEVVTTCFIAEITSINVAEEVATEGKLVADTVIMCQAQSPTADASAIVSPRWTWADNVAAV